MEKEILSDLVGVPGVTHPHEGALSTIESIYDRSGRRFSLDTVFALADRVLARLEIIHSRLISHSNLTPFTLATGTEGWQQYQIHITGFEFAEKATEPSAIRPGQHADLKTLGVVLVYLLGTDLPWADFRATARERGIARDQSIPSPMLTLLDHMDVIHSPDYSTLREICRNFSSDSFLETLDRQQKICPHRHSNATPLYKRLQLHLTKTGADISPPLNDVLGTRLVQSLSDTFDLYTALLLRKPASKKLTLPKPHDLPSHLWRDLRWYFAAAKDGPTGLRKTIVEMVYSFMTVLIEIVPSYKLQWLENLISLTKERMDLEDVHNRKALLQMEWTWRDIYNLRKAEVMPLASPCILSTS